MCRNIRRNQNNQQQNGDKSEESDNNDPPKSLSPTDNAAAAPPTPPTDNPDMDILDNIECKFNVNSFKMVYVIKSESYLYKRNALRKAKEVSYQNSGNGLNNIIFID